MVVLKLHTSYLLVTILMALSSCAEKAPIGSLLENDLYESTPSVCPFFP